MAASSTAPPPRLHLFTKLSTPPPWQLGSRSCLTSRRRGRAKRPPILAPHRSGGAALFQYEQLTGKKPDVSTILGYVGQKGLVRRFDGKASAMRDSAVL